MKLLEVVEVEKKYEKHIALDNVSLSIDQGQIFGLLGPNGAGKTSLIRIINQITAPDKGQVLFEGKPLAPHHVQDIGYLPEERGLYKKMKVGEQALYLAQLKGLSKSFAKQKLMHWFEKFEIASWWDKKVEDLSKGMAQKIQFVTTVLHEPKLLILDEPFSGFDPINTNLIKGEIAALREKGTTIIFSTHNMESVEEICDHIALINHSKKILDGNVAEIKRAYSANTYSICFEGEMVAFTNALWTGFELISHKKNENGIEAVVRGVDNKVSINSLLSAVISEVKVVSVNPHIKRMNDIFIEKVNENQKVSTDEED